MKYFKFVLFSILLFLFTPILKVNADIISNTSTNYYYANSSDVTSTTDFRKNPSTVQLFGKENYSPTYDDYEYLTGFDIYIPYNINQGSIYTVKVSWTVGNWSPDEFNLSNFNARLNGTAITHGVNGIISNQITTYFTNNCTKYSGTDYCDYIFTTTYTFTATTNNTAFRVGTYNNNAWSLIGAPHYLTSIASIKEVDVIVNNDSTIINQNEQIIDQNKQTNDKLDDLNNNQKETNDLLSDGSSPDLDFNSMAGWLPAGPVDSIINLPLTFFTNLSSNLGKSCVPVNVPLPFVDKNYQLPCIKSLFAKIDGFSTVWNLYVGTIASCLILFSYLIKLYKWVDDTLTYRENNSFGDWGGV